MNVRVADPFVDVVAALIIARVGEPYAISTRGGSIVAVPRVASFRALMTQRTPGRDYPFAWEFPGGKSRRGERAHDTLRRELHEEIGVHIDAIGPRVFVREFDDILARDDDGNRRPVRWSLYRVEGIVPGHVAPQEGQGIGWFTLDELTRMEQTPGNRAALAHGAVHAEFDHALRTPPGNRRPPPGPAEPPRPPKTKFFG